MGARHRSGESLQALSHTAPLGTEPAVPMHWVLPATDPRIRAGDPEPSPTGAAGTTAKANFMCTFWFTRGFSEKREHDFDKLLLAPVRSA